MSTFYVLVISTQFSNAHTYAQQFVGADPHLYHLQEDELGSSPKRLKSADGDSTPSHRISVLAAVCPRDDDFHPSSFNKIADDFFLPTDEVFVLFVGSSAEFNEFEAAIRMHITGAVDLVHVGTRDQRENPLAHGRRVVFEFLCGDSGADRYVPEWRSLLLAASDCLSPAKLEDCVAFVTSANIRCTSLFDVVAGFGQEIVVDSAATGYEGDIVFGQVIVAPPGGGDNAEGDEDDLKVAESNDPVWVVDHTGESMYFRSSFFVVAPLGNRESSTHVSGYVPEAGVNRGRDTLHWIGGESGLVGVLRCEGAAANKLAETSLQFKFIGVLQRRPVVVDPDAAPAQQQGGTNLNLLHLARTPRSTSLTTRIICVCGTSAEAGKSTFSAKVIHELSSSMKLTVGAIKATGTGGVIDMRGYLDAGAKVAFDQVDVGLPSTYTSPDRVLTHMVNAFLLCQDAHVDVIVVECGGDIIWANNPTLLSASFVTTNLCTLFVICNDTMSCIGVQQWLNGSVRIRNQPTEARLPPMEKVVFVASPFRNYGGAVARAEAIDGMPKPICPNDIASLGLLLRERLR